jgi:hypothetical protein
VNEGFLTRNTRRAEQNAANATGSPIAGAFSIGQQNTRVQQGKKQGNGQEKMAG